MVVVFCSGGDFVIDIGFIWLMLSVVFVLIFWFILFLGVIVCDLVLVL